MFGECCLWSGYPPAKLKYIQMKRNLAKVTLDHSTHLREPTGYAEVGGSQNARGTVGTLWLLSLLFAWSFISSVFWLLL